jgi:hypothetical protein
MAIFKKNKGTEVQPNVAEKGPKTMSSAQKTEDAVKKEDEGDTKNASLANFFVGTRVLL